MRAATLSDAPAILKMAIAFHSAWGQSKSLQEARVAVFVREAITNPAMLCVVTGEPVCGFMVARAGDNYLTGERVAEEICLWVDPSNRGGRGADFIAALESWADEKKCEIIKLTAQSSMRPEAVSRLYKSKGYSPIETAFVKRR